jgi:hypothetical protein
MVPGLLAGLCVYFSFASRRWWPLHYVFAVFWGLCTATLLAKSSTALVHAWWLLGMIYMLVLPIWQTAARRRREMYGE